MTLWYVDGVPAALSPFPSEEERALGERLCRLDLEQFGSVEHGDPDRLPLDLPPLSDDELVRSLRGPSSALDLVLLASIDPESLVDPRARLAHCAALERVARYVTSLQVAATRAIAGAAAGERYLDEVHVEHELAVASTTSQYSAGKAIEVARTLGSTFPGFEQALREGTVSRAHCTVLVDRTRSVVDPTALSEIGQRALAKARTNTPGRFGTEVEKLVARFDPDAAARHERATRRDRRVCARQLADGMGILTVVDEWPVVNAMYRTVERDGRALQVLRRAGENASRRARRKADRKVRTAVTHPHHRASLDGTAADILDTADATRADAFAARMLGTVADDGSVRWAREAAASVTVEVVIDLATLRREADAFGLVDGQPVPAEVAREWAAGATLWRRMVTDPVTGHRLDYGTRAYSAEPLRRYVLARDGGCRNPVCGVTSHLRLQADHAVEFPHGPTSAANEGSVCTTSHQLKTDHYVDITDSRADGSCTWSTRWGQVVRVPPRAYLAEPDPPPRAWRPGHPPRDPELPPF